MPHPNVDLDGDPSVTLRPSDAPMAPPGGGVVASHSPSTAPPVALGQQPSAPPPGALQPEGELPIESVTASAIPTHKPVAFIAIVVGLALAAVAAAAWALFFRG
jgi:hypothetical protein